MIAYCDTSFLISLYLTDTNSSRAAALISRIETPLPLTPLQYFELQNALRLCVFRKLIDSGRLALALDGITHDLNAAVMLLKPVSQSEVLQSAEKLSAEYTESLGNRSLDILHVATALCLGADVFITFDLRQVKLAKMAGMKVKP